MVGISPDDVRTLERFAASCAVPFRLGSDTDHSIARAYDVRRRLNLGTSRITYVIDKVGVVRDAHHSETSMGSHIHNAVRVLEQLR